MGFTDGENEKRFLALQQWKFYIRAAGNEKEKVKGYIPLAATCFHQLNLTLVISRAQTADSGERAERGGRLSWACQKNIVRNICKS